MKSPTSKGNYLRKFRSKVIAVDPVLTLYGKVQNQKEQLAYKIDTAMWIQQHIIELGDNIVRVKRFQLLFIFLEAAIGIVFNTYNLSTFVVRFLLNHTTNLSIMMAVAFYGYHIFCAAHDILMTIFAFSQTFNEIASTARIANQLSIYVADDAIRLRLLQFSQLCTVNQRKYTIFGLFDLDGSFIYAVVSGTATYIIILVQFGAANDEYLESNNTTSTN